MSKSSRLCLTTVALFAGACSGSNSPPPPDSCAGFPASAVVTAWTADPHFCLVRFADGLSGARQLATAPNGDIFVATDGGERDRPLRRGRRRRVRLARNDRRSRRGVSNHAIALTATHLYVSTDDHGPPIHLRLRSTGGGGNRRDRGQWDRRRRAHFAHAVDRRSEPAVREHRERQQRRRPRRRKYAVAVSRRDPEVRPGVDPCRRVPGVGRRAVRSRVAQRGRPDTRRRRPDVGRRKRPRQPVGRRERHPPRQPRRGGQPVRHRTRGAQLRIPVLLERGGLVGGRGGRTGDPTPGPRATRRRFRRRCARTRTSSCRPRSRCGPTWPRWTSSSTGPTPTPGSTAATCS